MGDRPLEGQPSPVLKKQILYATKEDVEDIFQECCSYFVRTCEADTEESVSDRDEFVVKLVLPICELKVGEVITATLFCET